MEIGGGFPEKVTAFHPEMAVHGRYGLPCPVCGSKVQRIVYAENESNYCPRCQTGGKLLSDRSLARLLKQDWPKTIDELELAELGKAGSARASVSSEKDRDTQNVNALPGRNKLDKVDGATVVKVSFELNL